MLMLKVNGAEMTVKGEVSQSAGSTPATLRLKNPLILQYRQMQVNILNAQIKFLYYGLLAQVLMDVG